MAEPGSVRQPEIVTRLRRVLGLVALAVLGVGVGWASTSLAGGDDERPVTPIDLDLSGTEDEATTTTGATSTAPPSNVVPPTTAVAPTAPSTTATPSPPSTRPTPRPGNGDDDDDDDDDEDDG